MIQVNGLKKAFDGFVALNGVDMHVEKGAIYGLVGPNGAGKSTLIRHLTGVYRPDQGEVQIDGENVYENKAVKSKIAYIPDELFYFMQADTMEMKRFYEGIYPSFDGKLFYRMQEFFPNIDVKRNIRRLSKGMQKQVAFWLAICCKPDILILDGISSETYAEQGMLEDLSGILKEAGLLDNIESAYTKEDGSIYEMPVKFGIPMIEGNKEDVQAVTDLASLADVLTKHKDEYGLTSENIYKLPLLYSMYPQALLEKLADNNSAAWMKANGTLDEEKIKGFLEQSERIYQAGKDAMDELKAAYPQAFDDSEQPVYERAGSISGETAVLLSRNCEFALGDIFSLLDFAFVNSMAEIDTSLAYALWNGQMANCFIPVSRIGISSRASQKAAAEKFVEYLFSEEGQMLSREDGFPVVEAVYNGEDYWNQGEAGNVLVTGGSSNSENGQELVYSIKVPSADKVNELKQLGKMLTTPVLDNTIITSAVCENGVRYLNGEISLDEAANAVMQQVNLYLAE